MTPAGPTYYTGARANFSRKLIKLELIIIKSLSPPIIALLSTSLRRAAAYPAARA
jgi:hypothetical protein